MYGILTWACGWCGNWFWLIVGRFRIVGIPTAEEETGDTIGVDDSEETLIGVVPWGGLLQNKTMKNIYRAFNIKPSFLKIYIHLIQSLPYLLPCCWLLARLLVDGLVAAKRAAAAEDAGTVGNGIDVDGMELKCPSIWDWWMIYWDWECASLLTLIFCEQFSILTEFGSAIS